MPTVRTIASISVALFLSAQVAHTQDLPYPPSTVIRAVAFDTSSVVTFGKGSDQWPMTWAADSSLVAAWGDGRGWSNGGPKRSIGVTRITGAPPDLKGEDLWGAGPGKGFAKPEALIALGPNLHMFWTNSESRNDDHNTSSALSTDGGRTWALDSLRAFPEWPDGFRVRGICQFGPGNAGAPDGNVYVYFGHSRRPDIYLARTPTRMLTDPSYYTWFHGFGPDGQAYWTRNFALKHPVFYDPHAYLWHIGVTFDAGLNRYLLTKSHYGPDDDPGASAAKDSGMAAFGIYDAPAPWGPWTTVFRQDDFLDDRVKFSYYIPPKFISEDGRSFWLAWSGWPEYDSISFIKGRFSLSE